MATGEQHHIEISGPGPYGFRLYGGEGDPFVVAKLRAKSKAQKAGIVEGDIIIGINGQTCQNISHAVAMDLLEKTTDTLKLIVLRGCAKDEQTISAGYQTASLQLRSVSPNVLIELSNQSTSNSLPTYQTKSLQEPVFESNPDVSYKIEEQTLYEGDTTRKVTTESKTEQWGGTTVTSVKTHEITKTPWKESSDDQQKIISSFQVSSVNGTNPASAVWVPGSRSIAHEQTFNVDNSVRIKDVESKRENVRLSSFHARATNKPQTSTSKSSSGFKVSKTPAKPWVWQPSFKPVLPQRQPSPGFQLDSQDQLLNVRSPESFHSEDRNKEESTSSKRDQTDLPNHLLRILTEESNDYETMKRKKKIFADSSFYDDPKHRYPTIEEQIKMARKVAMSLTAPDRKSVV